MNQPSERKAEFRHDSVEDAQSIAAYLQALIDGFESGVLHFADDSGEIDIEPRGLVDFEMRASSRPEKATLKLKFTWKDRRRTKEPGALNIESQSRRESDS